ncbi:MAG: hypothetical protein L6V84_08300 [Oscillospiraceae bacterium]|nr:MAG: hypothetical protein L6V84_08300 [Oscillospiraceae bacterium]
MSAENSIKTTRYLTWIGDLIIVDEAHEGTQTELGDHVIKQLRKASTKVLALSGTPFNLLDKFGEDNVYTWDYVMEQKKKAEWDAEHYGDHNPYADLPQMHIYTYDLGEKLKKICLGRIRYQGIQLPRILPCMVKRPAWQA